MTKDSKVAVVDPIKSNDADKSDKVNLKDKQKPQDEDLVGDSVTAVPRLTHNTVRGRFTA